MIESKEKINRINESFPNNLSFLQDYRNDENDSFINNNYRDNMINNFNLLPFNWINEEINNLENDENNLNISEEIKRNITKENINFIVKKAKKRGSLQKIYIN